MEVLYAIYVFIFGTILGSFYNVVGYRLPKNLSIVKPGSFCPKCNHALKWYELVPVFSFLVQKGKCRKCGCKISLFYPLIESLTGFLFLASYLKFGFSFEFLVSIIIFSFLVIVIVSDTNYLIIPDEVTVFFSILIIVITLIFKGFDAAFDSVISGAFLFAVMYFIMLLGNLIFKKESLGGGDIKLMFFVGLILSPVNGFFSIFLSSALALPISFWVLIKRKNRIIPFGPFILLAISIIYFFNLNAVSLFKIL